MPPESPGGKEFFVTDRNMMELTNTHETTYLGCETKFGLCKNGSATMACQKILSTLGKNTHLRCVHESSGCLTPPQSLTLKPCGTCDTDVFPEHRGKGLSPQPHPSLWGPFSRLQKFNQASGYNTLKAFPMLPAQEGRVRGGVKATGWSESPQL